MTTLAKRFKLRVCVDGVLYKLNICRVGFTPKGEYDSSDPAYRLWIGMIRRCYDKKSLELYPSYKGVEVCEDWHNYQNFAKWAYQQWNAFKDGFNLDKDLLVVGSKIYSPDTCSFVPREINSISITRRNHRGDLPIGVVSKAGKYSAKISIFNKVVHLGTFDCMIEAFKAYKKAKEDHIKELANIWKHVLSDTVYSNLMTWEVNIND